MVKQGAAKVALINVEVFQMGSVGTSILEDLDPYPATDALARATPSTAKSHYAPPAPGAPVAPGAPTPARYGPLVPQRSVGAAYAFLLLLGGIGAHRFYLSMPWTGATLAALWVASAALIPFHSELFPFAALVIWLIVDLCTLPSMVADANLRALSERR